MRQHILRLLIVLILAVGIGAIIYFAIQNNTPFVITDYINTESKKDVQVETNFNNLSSLNDASFSENVFIYNVFEDSINYCVNLLTNAKFEKSEASQLKSAYKSYHEDMITLNNSMEILKDYLEDAEQNATELAGRKEKVNSDLVKVLKEKSNIVQLLNKLTTEKIYGGASFDTRFVLNNTIDIMSDCYLNFNTNYTLLNSVNIKYNDFVSSKKVANDDMVKFVIKFNEMTENVVKQDFEQYFNNETESDNLRTLLSFLNSEAYYEKN